MALPTLSANSPSAGYISWTAFSIRYGDVSRDIAAGNTNKRYAYWLWNGGNPASTLTVADELPTTLTADDLVLFVNRGGIPVNAQSANVIEGSLIATESIIGSSLQANTVDATRIQADTLTSREIKAGAITASELSLSSYGSLQAVNGDMEDIDPVTKVPAGWTAGFERAGTPTYSVETAAPLSGTQSVKITVPANGVEALASAATPVKAGDRIMFGTAFRVDTVNAPVTLRAYFGSTPDFDRTQLIATTPATPENVYIYDVTATGMVPRSNVPSPVTGPGIAAIIEGWATPVTTSLYVTGQVTVPQGARFVRFVLASGLQSNSPAHSAVWDALDYAPIVTSARIADGAITARQIGAAAITADHIKANSLTVDKLMVGASDNLVANPHYLNNAQGWQDIGGGPGSGFVTSPTYGLAQMSAKLTQRASGDSLRTLYGPYPSYGIPVSPGEALTAYSWVIANGSSAIATTIQQRIYFYDATGTQLAGSDGNIAGGSINGSSFAANAWTRVGGTPVTVPAGAAYCVPRVTIYMTTGAPTSTVWHVGPTTMVRAMTGDLIVNGAIDGKTINGASITGGTITGGLFRTASSGPRWEIFGSGSSGGSYNNLIGYAGIAEEGQNPASISTFYDSSLRHTYGVELGSGTRADGVGGAFFRVSMRDYASLPAQNYSGAKPGGGEIYAYSADKIEFKADGQILLNPSGSLAIGGSGGIFASQQSATFKKVAAGSGDAHGTNYGEVYRSATQSLATGAWTAISWNAWGSARMEDDGSLYSSTYWRSQTAGVFTVTSSVTFATAGTGYRAIRIKTEGGSVIQRDGFDQAGTPFRDIHISGSLALPGGGYGVNTEVYQNSGAAINAAIHASDAPTMSRFVQVA